MLNKCEYAVNWKTIKLGDIADFKNGLNYRAGENKFSYRILSVASFQDHSVIRNLSDLPNVDLDQPLEEGYRLVDRDLVFVRSNGNPDLVGRCVMVFPGNVPTTFSGFTIRARILKNKIVDPEWVHICLKAGLLKKSLKKEGAGTNITNLNQQILSSVLIPVPSMEEQKVIVSVLSTWDEAIEKTERLIASKEHQFEWLVNKFIGKRTAEVSLAKVCPPEMGDKLTKREDLGYLEIGDIDVKTKDYQIDNKEKKPVSGAVKVPANTLLISTVRPTRGAITRTKSELYVSSAFCKLRLTNDFYFYCLFQRKFFDYLKHRQSGATYPTVKDIDILTFKIPVASESEQKKITQILNSAKQEIDLLKKLSDVYRVQKQGLMQKLLTGKWRVNFKEEK